MLKLGGRAAVIVPDGVLFGSSGAHKNIRKELVDNQQLEAVISMPSGIFKPYAGVSTAILFFTKTNSGGTDNVWFYDMQADGFSLDDKRNAQLSEEVFEECFVNPASVLEVMNGKCDIPNILLDWNVIASATKQTHDRFNDRTQKSFLIPKADIVANDYDLSINRYKEIIYDEVVYEKPQILIADIKAIDKKRLDAMLDLEKMLG
jgi:type I restriction enzyme M protein